MKSRFKFVSIALCAGAAIPVHAQVKPSTDWATKKVPIEVFAQFPMIDRPTISPDGKLIATKVRAGGKQVLALLPVGVGETRPLIIARDENGDADRQGDRQIISYRWLDNDHLLIGFSSRDNFIGEWFDNTRYASYNVSAKKISPLGWDKSLGPTQVLWASHDGKPRIALQRVNLNNGTERYGNPEVIEVEVDGGREHISMRSNPMVRTWDTDEDGVVRLGYSREADTGKLQVLYRSNGNAPMKSIYSGIPDRYAGHPLPEIMLPATGKAYATSNADGYNALYEYDLTTMKLGRKVYGVQGYDIGSVAISPDRTRIEGVEITRQRTSSEFFDPRLKEVQTALEESFGKGNIHIGTADAARETIVFSVSALGQPVTWYVYDTRTGKIRRFAFANETLKDAMLNPVSMVRYPASDGKQIEAVLTMPRHRAGEKNLPLIVLPHGGPWARDDADWDAYGWAQALAELGYVVVQPNFRGSTGYGKDWEKAAEKSWGLRMQDDLNDAVTWLAGQGTADPKRVCMMGWSYGGYAASRAAQRDGTKYRCAISGAGVHDLPAMVRYDKGYLGAYGAKMGLGTAGDLVAVSPGLHPGAYSTSILVVHGAKDQRVPVAQSRDLIARLKKAGKIEGKDFVYIEQPLNTHNLLREADRIQLLQETKKFLDRHNPA